MSATQTLCLTTPSRGAALLKCMARAKQAFNPTSWLLTVFVLVAGSAASMAVHDSIMASHLTTVQETLKTQADRAADELGDRLDVRRRAVARYGSVWSLYERMTDDRWDVLTKNFAIESKELQAVMWVDATFTIRKITPADIKVVPESRLGESSRTFAFLKRIPESSSEVVVSSVVTQGGESRIFFVVPLHRRSGGFDGFLLFMLRADIIISDTAKAVDPRIGFEIFEGAKSLYQSTPALTGADMSHAVTMPVPSSDDKLQIKVVPLVDLQPNQTLLAKILMIGGFVLTTLIALMVLQMSYLARARRELHSSRLLALANENRYRSLITGCDLGWVVIDENFCVIDANDPYIRMTGHKTYAEIADRSLLDWVDPTDHTAVNLARKKIGNVAPTATQDRVNYRWADGTIRHVDVDFTVREGRNGMEIVALCRDVTDQTTVRKNLELHDRAMEASSSAILITAMGNNVGTVVYCNRAFESMTGYSRAEIVGSTPNFLGDDKANEAELRRMQANLISGQSAQASLITYRKDGERIIRHVSTTPVMGEDGRPTHLISISTDITDEARKAEHLRLRERAIEASQNGVMIVDARQHDNPIIFCNHAFEQITGYSASDALGQNCRFLQADDREQPELETLRRALSAHESASVTLRNYRRDGTLFWNELHIDPVVDDSGHLTHFIGIINDVTARKEAEGQLLQVQKMDAIGQLTGGVAHDFNNLLTVVIGNSKLIQQTLTQDEKQQRRLNLVIRAAERGADLTQRLLAFSRKQTLRTEVLDVNTMVQEMQHLVQRTIGENIATKMALSDAPCTVRVDRGQLENALLNLAINARDAMPNGGNLIVTTRHLSLSPTVASRMNIPTGHYVELAISDTGVGMTNEIKQRAFEPFFTTKDVGKGTGLGLSMVFGFVKQSEGHVSIYSELGHGTTVKLYLPSGDAAEKDQHVPLAVLDVAEPTASYKVLVVEDDENVRATTTSILESKGFTVIEACSADSALETLEHSHDIDVVFSDVIMPGKLNGIELFRLIRSRYPNIRVVLTSGYPREALKLDLDDTEGPLLINKPYDPKQLAKTLAYYAETGMKPAAPKFCVTGPQPATTVLVGLPT